MKDIISDIRNEYYKGLMEKYGVESVEQAEARELQHQIKNLVEDTNFIKSKLGIKKLFYLRKPLTYIDLYFLPNYQHGKDILYKERIYTYRSFFEYLISYREYLISACVKKGYPIYSLLNADLLDL